MSLHGVETFEVYTDRNFEQIPQLSGFTKEVIAHIKAVSSVLPFRVNRYVIDNLIDWSNIPNDPIYQMVFPQPGMLSPEQLNLVLNAQIQGVDKAVLEKLVGTIRMTLNPHPADQQSLNVPVLNGVKQPGVQHKYKDTMLFFPKQGQTCHSYCTFCFRWAQFIGDKELRFANQESDDLLNYASAHKELSDVIFTGGDPMVMKTKVLEKYIEPFFLRDLDHIQNIRIGTKALSYWPQRFVTDSDADDLLRLIERLVNAGKHVTIMAHYNHWHELEPTIAKKAVQRLQSAGAIIRSQGPLLAHINDTPAIWNRMWREQVKLGIIPYYMFVERDTGPKNYFEKTLVDAVNIFNEALRDLSGLCQTVRGPSMSVSEGKVKIEGVISHNQEKLLLLRYLRARDESWTNQLFFAKYNPSATWFNELVPAYPSDEKYFK